VDDIQNVCDASLKRGRHGSRRRRGSQLDKSAASSENESEFKFWKDDRMRRCFATGVVICLAATLVLRYTGQYLLQAESLIAIAALLAASFPLMALVARRVCAGAGVPRDQWPSAAIFLVMPTLVLDTFSSVFFSVVYPNISPQAAGLYGGWILWCCAGALAGVTLARR
jgi:hypothetical protein